MKIIIVILSLIAGTICLSFGLRQNKDYNNLYFSTLSDFRKQQTQLLSSIEGADLASEKDLENIRAEIKKSRVKLKKIDFWLRYFEPVAYRKLNGPLPIEWETEVFEKFEPPYRRKGAGLTLAQLYMEEEGFRKDSLVDLIQTSIDSLQTFDADSITSQLNNYEHFFLANRLHLLNLAAIYTTGFECPDTSLIIPELRQLLPAVQNIYANFNTSFPSHKLPDTYLILYDKAIRFVNEQPADFSLFDHFTFIRDYVNPLFKANQSLITQYSIYSTNYNDYALSNEASSIFSKSLFISQNTKGIFSLVDDEEVLASIKEMGKLLFYDPILSGNNKRSCASCHRPTEYFTDTSRATALQFDDQQSLARNAPSLVNSVYNHLAMLDGKHISLQGQATEVILNHSEMQSDEKTLLKKVLSCNEYKTAFRKMLKYTPEEKSVSLSHIVSAITYYYADFSNYYSPFDDAMTLQKPLNGDAKAGFNLFMSKAICATCHFVPHFNGVKPPYIGSEFEVLGVPADTSYTRLSEDKGRYLVNPAPETLHAFRTGSIRNAEHTKPYMHNGVFTTLDQVIDFYDMGGGQGRKLLIDNQTLASDSLKLSVVEKSQLIAFMHSMNENIIFDAPPARLPASSDKSLNNRKVGGDY